MNSQQLCFEELDKKKEIIGVDFVFEVFNDTDINPLSSLCARLSFSLGDKTLPSVVLLSLSAQNIEVKEMSYIAFDEFEKPCFAEWNVNTPAIKLLSSGTVFESKG